MTAVDFVLMVELMDGSSTLSSSSPSSVWRCISAAASISLSILDTDVYSRACRLVIEQLPQELATTMRGSILTAPSTPHFTSPVASAFPSTPGRHSHKLERTRSAGSSLSHARSQSVGGGHVRGQSFSSLLPPTPGPAPPGIAEYEWTEIQSR